MEANVVTAPALTPRAGGRTFSLAQAGFAAATAVVLGWAFAPFVLVALDAAHHHRVFLGIAGYYPMDGLQYLAWIRDGQHGLIRNLFGTAGGAVFVHPMWSLSGIVQGVAGVRSPVIMAFWKAVSAMILLLGCRRLVNRHISTARPGARSAAFVLALFGGLTPFVALLLVFDRSNAGMDFARAAGDLVPASALWGYEPLAIAMGLMPLAIEGMERLVAGSRGWRPVLAAAGLGLCVAWLHPWQGQTLITVAAGLVLWRWLERRGAPVKREGSSDGRPASRSLVVALIATAAPLLYYVILSKVDPGWRISERGSVAAAMIPWPVFLWCVAPLALIWIAAARRVLAQPACRGLLLWPVATMLSVALSPSGEYRALDGVAMPMAVLVAMAWPARPAPRRSLAVVAVTLGLAPFVFFAGDSFSHLHSVRQYTELAPNDVRAARLAAQVSRRRPLLAPVALGTAIPALTDASTWVGHPIWTPYQAARATRVWMLFAGMLAPEDARRFVQSTGARALVEPCGFNAALENTLSALGFRETLVGCARVYSR